MAEYIEREAASELMDEAMSKYDGYDNCQSKTILGIMEAQDLLYEIPAADVAPVRHGRWEPRKDVPGFVNCSVCHDCNIYDDWADGKKWKYCPNCGAKMDLEGGDGDGR